MLALRTQGSASICSFSLSNSTENRGWPCSCFKRPGKIGFVGQRPPLAIDAVDDEAGGDTGGDHPLVHHVGNTGREREWTKAYPLPAT